MKTTEELIERLLQLFNEHKVKYVVIGALALPAYGHIRTTEDIDIFIEPNEGNALKAIEALKDFGYLAIEDLTIKEFLSKKTLFRQYLLPTDIHPFVKGVNFEDLWENRVSFKIGSIYVYLPSLEDMIKMKKAAGRPKDLEDLKYLNKIKELKKKKKSK